MMEYRARQHQTIDDGRLHTYGVSRLDVLEQAAGLRAVQHNCVIDPGKVGGDDVRLAVNHKSHVADQGFIQNLINSLAVVMSPLRQAFDAVLVSLCIVCHECILAPYSVSNLSAHSINCTNMDGLAKVAFFPSRSVSRTPRAREHAPQTWIGIPSEMVLSRISASGGHPTGTTASATGVRMRETPSPNKKIWVSCPASASAFA